MRLVYLDAALQSNSGHHASYCRMITQESKRLGVSTIVFGSSHIDAKLKSELSVVPLFRAYSYDQSERSKDALAGWLRDYEFARQHTFQDLGNLGPVGSEDVLYINSIFPAHFHSTLEWLRDMPIPSRPRVVIEFGTEPGVTLAMAGKEIKVELQDPRKEPRATLYRFAASYMDETLAGSITLMTFDPFVSSIYQVVTERPVATYCWPHLSVTTVRKRTNTRPITIGILGHQRIEKGYHLVPEVLREFVGDQRVTFLIHNAAPEGLRAIQESIRSLARNSKRFFLDENPRGAEWGELLERTDLMLCPYDPVRYASSHSALLTECLANGIPTVVPARTVLASMAARHGGCAVEFTQWTASAIAAALRTAITDFDRLAECAQNAAIKWSQSQGAPKLVRQILGMREQ